jgi:hypothetical protein
VASSTLRPLSIGEILDAGIKVVIRHWKPLMTCIVGLVGPVWIIYVLLLGSLDPEALELDPETSQTTEDVDAAVVVGLIGSFVLLALTFMVAFIACFKGVSDAWLGATPEAGRSLRFGLKRAPRVFLLSLVWWPVIILASIPCGIPAIWLGVAWSLSIPAMLFERVGPFKALGRSFGLIKGRWWASFALVLVGYLLVTILGGVFQVGLLAIAELTAGENAVANATAQVVGYTISSAVTYPYLAAVLTILYFDQRVRKEGFDLQLLAEGLGAERDPNAPLPDPLIGEELYTPSQRGAAPYWPPPPGWKPPPPEDDEEPAARPSEWSHPAGWSAPAAPDPDPPLWGSGSEAPRGWDPPKPREEPAADPPAFPGSYPTRSTAPPPPPPPPEPEREPESPRDESVPPPEPKRDEDQPKPDGKRADWLPPEAPRGPGGL